MSIFNMQYIFNNFFCCNLQKTTTFTKEGIVLEIPEGTGFPNKLSKKQSEKSR